MITAVLGGVWAYFWTFLVDFSSRKCKFAIFIAYQELCGWGMSSGMFTGDFKLQQPTAAIAQAGTLLRLEFNRHNHGTEDQGQ